MLILGIDEAGRGPIIGPLVIAGVVVSIKDEQILLDWGIKDSKVFGSSNKGKEKMAELSDKIQRQFKTLCISISQSTVDKYVYEKSLNRLEQENAKIILDTLNWDKAILDGEKIFAPLVNQSVLAKNKADQNCISVAAASIVAKHSRDQWMTEFVSGYKQEFGEIKGGGYVNQKTLEFVLWHMKEKGAFPNNFRESYKWKALEKEIG